MSQRVPGLPHHGQAEAENEPAHGGDQHQQGTERHAFGEETPGAGDDAPVELVHLGALPQSGRRRSGCR